MEQAKTVFRSLLESFVFGNILVAFCGIALSLSTYLILDLETTKLSFSILALIFFACLFIYNLNVFFLGKFDQTVAREKWKEDNLRVVKIFSLFSVVPILFYARSLSINSLWILSHLFLLAILYVVPIKFNGKYYSFRKIPLLKIFILAYVWSFVTVVLPATEAGFLEADKVVLLFLERFLFIVGISIPFDIRDYERDKAQGTLTIPVWMGKRNALITSFLLVMIFVSFSVIFYEWSFITFSRVISGLLALLFIVNVVKVKEEFYFLFCLDGLMLLHFLILWISKQSFFIT